jgi:hypothetical protein
MSRIALALTTTLLAIPLAAAAMSGDGGMTGKPAPEIAAGQWYNHVGRDLNLKNLRGQTVLIEFWATW